METFHIHIQGIVQGVGYRPFISQFAKERNLLGKVANGSDGLHIFVNTSEKKAQNIFEYLKGNKPAKAKIFTISIEKIAYSSFNNFSIVESNRNNNLSFISPDFSICEACKSEMFDSSNRRYLYPFITCSSCGPRFSIMNQLPYDREYTTMASFTMCETCQDEYQNINDRRYFSQTNSCTDCGIKIIIKDNEGVIQSHSLENIANEINKGKIIVVKGIGGYLIVCDATNRDVISLLRQRKRRPTKPLAVMFSDLDQIASLCQLSQAEKSELDSEQAPIVLCKIKKECILPMDVIAPGLDTIGAMIPNNGLLLLLSKYLGKPMIATSANISGSPILYLNDEAEKGLSSVYDYIITHNRDIIIPQDDSVVKYTPFCNKKVILRRGRGIAPTFWKKVISIEDGIFGSGALMKSSFSFAVQDMIFTSQFLGDLSSYESSEMYLQTLNHFNTLLKVEIKTLVKDMHPSFPLEGQLKTIFSKAATQSIQHHKAHFYAILLEHDLLNSDEKILGVIWDGIGYGEDSQIWGGEFFEFNKGKVERILHLEYFPYLLGDKMSLQPRIAALALFSKHENLLLKLKGKFSEKEFDLYVKLLNQTSPVSTSSMGRIFDAISSLLGLCDINDYEGKAAMLLEQLANNYFIHHHINSIIDYYTLETKENEVSYSQFLEELYKDIDLNVPIDYIAAKFHISLIMAIKIIAKPNQVIAFSGGVWQNGLLVDIAIHYLSGDHKLYFHEQLSPNDENVSVGQVAYGMGLNLK